MQRLRKLGLSSLDVRIYNALLNNNSLLVSELAKRLSTTPVGLYRSIERLQKLGFVVEIGNYPKQYQARSLDSALDHYLAYQEEKVNGLRHQAPGHPSKPPMQVLTGRNEIFATYIKLAKHAKHDLLTISIGEEVPEEMYQVKANAIEAGVQNYLIFQKHSRQNDMWLKRWKSMGSYVRILPGQGYHLNIIDNDYAILSSSSTSNTLERTAVLISSKNVILELRKYFYRQWEMAHELSRLKLAERL